MDIQLLQHLLLKRLSFPHRSAFETLSKISNPYLFLRVSRYSIDLHVYPFHQHSSALITIATEYALISGKVTTPTLFFYFTVSLLL